MKAALTGKTDGPGKGDITADLNLAPLTEAEAAAAAAVGGGKCRLSPGWRSLALKFGDAEGKALRKRPANVKRGVAQWLLE